MSSEPIIEINGLGKVYHLYRRPQDRLRRAVTGATHLHDEFWALRGLDLAVGRGESLGIIGRNGAGKSTLLQLICGTLTPSVGTVRVHGRIAAMLELGAGFHGEFTGRENIALNATLLGLTPEEIKHRLPAIAAFADIGDYLDQPVKHYSSGMYARLAFAVSAHVDADILVVDEILAVGDFTFQQKCMRFLHDFRRRGTLLFVSHDDGAVARLCDRALLLDHGVVRDYGEAREVTRRYRVLQSEQMTDGEGEFRHEGTLKALPVISATKSGFDAEAPGPADGSAEILDCGLYDAEGAVLGVVAGGEEVALRVRFRCGQAMARPVVGFALRDRLAQVLLGDETGAGETLSLEAGDTAQASFQFVLPYMASGSYAVELFVFDGARLAAHLQDAAVLSMQSRHISSGLANVAMQGVALSLDAAEGAGP